METSASSVSFLHTKGLKDVLEREFSEVIAAQLNILKGPLLSENKPYKKDEDAEYETIMDLISDFKEECESNFLLFNDADAKVRYFFQLGRYFDFLRGSYAEIGYNLSVFELKVGKEAYPFESDNVNLKSDFASDWIENHQEAYCVRLHSWSAFMADEIVREVEDVINGLKQHADERDVDLKDVSFITTKSISTKLASADQESQPTEPSVKKSKKEQQTGLKEQLILLNEVGLLNAGKLAQLNSKQKAKLLALLLNRTEKDTYELLRNWQSRKDPKEIDSKYLIKEHHEETVKDWLLDVGVLL